VSGGENKFLVRIVFAATFDIVIGKFVNSFKEQTTIMKMQELREIAKKRGIKTANMKKTDIIRAIQRDESNADCYSTGNVDKCGQTECLWITDCA
jgi:hypothetical protein